MIVIPLPDTIAVEVKSPVLGLYSSLVFPVYRFCAVPDVAAANTGYKLEVVLVSLLRADPPIDFQAGDEPL